MLKKSILTPVLSGVLAVTVVGSGVLYYVDNKNSDDNKDKEKDKSSKTVSEVSDTVKKTLDTADKAIKGELDFSYSAKADFILGKGITDELDFDVKPFSFETSTKQKGKKTAADFSVKYDSKNLVSLNSVMDNDEQIVYLKVPELSDAYLSFSADDIEKMLNDSTNFPSAGTTTMAVDGANGLSADAMKVLEEIDYEKLFEDLEEYVDVVEKNAPEGKDNGTVTGDIDGNSYEYTVKTYDVTGQVVVDMVNAAADKAKNDDFIKDICTKLGASESDYDSMISSIKDGMSMDESQLSETLVSFDVYYLGDDVTGFATNIEDGSDDVAIKMISIENDDVFAVDFSCLVGNEGMTLKGSAKTESDKLNGQFDFKMNTDDDSDMSMTLSFKDVEEKGDMFAGTIRYDISVTNYGETVAPSIELTSNSTEDKLDMTLSVTESGTDYVTVTLTGEATDASDITIPSDNIFSCDESGVESYLATCNTDTFVSNVKSALGDELYTALFESDVYDDEYYDIQTETELD